MISAEILAAGTELLTGEVQDTDTRFLARTVTGLGGVVARASTLPDDPPALEAAVREALARGPRVLLTCGGLGPTVDDGTLAAVAAAAGVPLEEDAEALGMVARRYGDLAARGWTAGGGLTPARRKMARIPRGGRPVENPAGAAPAVVLQAGPTTVICLPGVPAELEAIVEGPLRPVLASIFGSAVHLEDGVVVHTGDESAVAPAVEAAARAFPGVRVKSRARRFGPGVRITVTLSARGPSAEEVRPVLAACRAALLRACAERGLECG